LCLFGLLGFEAYRLAAMTAVLGMQLCCLGNAGMQGLNECMWPEDYVLGGTTVSLTGGVGLLHALHDDSLPAVIYMYVPYIRGTKACDLPLVCTMHQPVVELQGAVGSSCSRLGHSCFSPC
jgi:hypothetical protein